MSTEAIKVCCRFRKEFNHDESEYDSWNFDDETATIALEEKKWTYDYILPPDTTQEEMYNKVAIKTINDFTEGYHGTIFAYGQSGSGKTFSMIGPDSVFECLTNANTKNDLYGITPRAVYQIYDQLKEFSRNGSNWKLCLSYIEIYNEKVKCLLSGKEGLKIREVPHEGFIIQDKDILDCKTPEDVFKGISIANSHRATGATKQNERSSRSHAIMMLELINNTIEGVVKKSRLCLVDLAGSERIAKTAAEGQRLKEAQKINQSLTTLGMVIMALTTPGCKHVPFRNSKLTLILKDSLGGSSKTTLLCTASRLKLHKDESIQTLYFASRAKSIKNVAKQNVILNANELKYIANGLKKELMLLRGQVKKIGYQWKTIEDGKLLAFITNEEYEEDGADYTTILGAANSTPMEKPKQQEGVNSITSSVDSKELNAIKESLEKIIEELKKKIETLEKEIATKNKKLEEFSDVSHIVDDKKKLEIEIEEIKKKLEAKEDNEQNLQSQLQIYELENEGLNGTITDLQESSNKISQNYQAEINSIKGKLSQKEKEIQDIENKAQLAEEKNKTLDNIYETKEKVLRNEIDANKATIDKLNKLLKDTVDDKTLFEEKEKLYDQTIACFRTSNDSLLKENEELKKELLKVKQTYSENNSKIKNDYEKQLSTLNSELINKENIIKENVVKLESIQKLLDNANQKYELLKTLSDEQKNQITQLTSKLNEKQVDPKIIEDNTKLNEENQLLKDKVLTLEQQNFELNQTIQNYSSTITKSFNKSKAVLPFSRKETMSDSKSSAVVKSVFGVNLKKVTAVSGKTNVPDFLSLAKEESQKQAKQTELLFKDQLDLLSDLRKNMIYESPKTVSSRSDINDDDIPELDFTNEETFKKAEEILMEKELKHEQEKEKKKKNI